MMQYNISTCQVNNLQAICTRPYEIRHDSKISTHNMTCNYFVVCIQLEDSHVFYKKVYKKDPCSFVFLKEKTKTGFL